MYVTIIGKWVKRLMNGICYLCNENKKLIRSHTIPEGFHKGLYDEYRRICHASKSREELKYIQNGHYENLLCENCDINIIGKYDKYAIEVIRDRKYIQEHVYNNCLIWDGLDYEKFKLFHLSILWRLHISKKYSRGVKLTDSIAMALRQHILSGTVPDDNAFPVFGYYLLDPVNGNSLCDEIITYGNCYPQITEINIYVVIYGGIAWHYLTPGVKENDDLQEFILKKGKPFLLPKRNIYEFQPFLDVYDSVYMVTSSKN